jgi:hypothetical protein
MASKIPLATLGAGSGGLRAVSDTEPSPPEPVDLRAACERVMATIDLGMAPLIDDVRTLKAQCDSFIAEYDEDTKRITREILDAIFGKLEAESPQ